MKRTNPSPPSIPPTPSDEIGRAMHRELLAFVLDDRVDNIRIAYRLSKFKRRQAHDLASGFGLEHISAGLSEQTAHVLVWKRGTKRPSRNGSDPSMKDQVRPVSAPSRSNLVVSAQPTREEIKKTLETFLADTSLQSFNFPLTLDTEARAIVHELAGTMGLDHDSFGEKGLDRYVRVTRVDPEVLRQRLERQNGLNVAYRSYLKKIEEVRTRDGSVPRHFVPHCTTPPKAVEAGSFRVVQWNIEWMSNFFDINQTPRFLSSNAQAEIDDTDSLCKVIASCIFALDPDVLFIEEGPSNKDEMELFVRTYLKDAFYVLGGLENLSQQLYCLIRKGGPVSNGKIHQKSLEFLTRSFFYDVDGDRSLIDYKFTRRPLVVEAQTNAGETVYFVVAHLKSKFVARGRNMWLSTSPEDVELFVNKSIANRRRIQAECFRLRQCISEVILSSNPNALVVVGGDLNEGPGSGFFEEFYGLINLLDALLGSRFYRTETLFPVLDVPEAMSFTAEFDDYVDNIHPARVLLDHVFVSRALTGRVKACIAHDVFQKGVIKQGRTRQERPSDHRPMVADFHLKK